VTGGEIALPIVEAHAITQAYGETEALKGVDLALAEGSVLELLGPNGAGKTTAIRILTTLLRPDSGTALVAGHDVLREPERVRAGIGLAGQSVTMDGYLSGMQNLTMIGRLYRFSRKDARRRVRELIEQFDLTDAAHRPVKTYSGGMRRRLDLAASLIAAPPVLFLDEPTAGLDPESRNTAWEVIRGLVRSGTTVLLTTQYIEEADQLADTATINHGRIITSDTPARLKAEIGGERLDIRLADPTAIARVPQLRELALPVEVEAGALSFALANGDRGLREVGSILEALIDRDVEVDHYEIKSPTLEEAFLQLVGGTSNKSQPKETVWMEQAALSIPQAQRRPRLFWVVSDTWELFKRTLIQIRQTPGDLVSFVIVQPVLLIVLFRYVFGGAVETGETGYADFLIPGVIAANAALIGTTAAVGVATDISEGIVDRFRSLPMSQSAIIGGTVLANTARSMAALAAMVLMGLVVGFSPDADLGGWLAVIGLVLLMSYAFSWLLAIVGVVAGSIEAAWQMTALVWPLTFVSSAFVPTGSMPSGLEAFAANQPISQGIDAVRALLLGQPVGDQVWTTVAWCAGLAVVGATVAGVLFRCRFS
jgi:ABC-2 type transport system ATP-binding protein